MQQFNNDHMEAVTAIEEIIDEANKIYQIPGLGTEVTLKLVECMHNSWQFIFCDLFAPQIRHM